MSNSVEIELFGKIIYSQAFAFKAHPDFPKAEPKAHFVFGVPLAVVNKATKKYESNTILSTALDKIKRIAPVNFMEKMVEMLTKGDIDNLESINMSQIQTKASKNSAVNFIDGDIYNIDNQIKSTLYFKPSTKYLPLFLDQSDKDNIKSYTKDELKALSKEEEDSFDEDTNSFKKDRLLGFGDIIQTRITVMKHANDIYSFYPNEIRLLQKNANNEERNQVAHATSNLASLDSNVAGDAIESLTDFNTALIGENTEEEDDPSLGF